LIGYRASTFSMVGTATAIPVGVRSCPKWASETPYRLLGRQAASIFRVESIELNTPKVQS
jgi:hypothetical protein